jgi:uncharacterized protein
MMTPLLPSIDLSDLENRTIEYGEGWGYPHVRRVLRLVDEIGSDTAQNESAILYAAYLHDWGAFPRYRQDGIDHALRSRQIAEVEILPETDLSASAKETVLNAIELHDYRDTRPAEGEALVLREADMLDMLGVIGMVRVFAWGPNNLKTCYERVMSRYTTIGARLTLPKSQQLGAKRLASMEQALHQLIEESFNIL